VNLAEQYIDDVVNNRIIAGDSIKRAVFRHLDDLKHAKERGWYFDKRAGGVAIKAIKLIPHTSGKWAGQPFQLQGWQAFVLWSVYGWKLKATKDRRFQKVYIKIARKNGKTEFLAAIACLDMTIFGIEGGELWWAATKKEQAKIGWKRQHKMINKLCAMDKGINRMFETNKLRIINKKMSMFADSIGRDSNTEDGHLVYRGYIDEFHAHKTDEMVNILESGSVSFEGSCIWIITTAGYNKASYCKHFEDSCKQVLQGKKENHGLFAMIFDMDEGDDWEDVSSWYKANPGLGVSPTLNKFRQIYQNALTEGASKRIDFLTKNLNVWTNSEVTWIVPEIWHKSGQGSEVTKEDLKGRECYGGLDLSSTKDITCLSLEFPLDNDYYAVLLFAWIPEDTARERAKEDGVKYLEWIDEGWLFTTPGNVVDYNYIKQFIAELKDSYDIQAINYDRWNSSQLVNDLVDEGAPMHPFGQGFASMSGPTKEVERKVLRGQYVHFNNPLLAWRIDNVMILKDAAGNIKIAKDKSSEKVDGAVAMVMSEGAWMSLKEEKKVSVYEERGVRTL
jgi:phage terminase large subunit-like protein